MTVLTVPVVTCLNMGFSSQLSWETLPLRMNSLLHLESSHGWDPSSLFSPSLWDSLCGNMAHEAMRSFLGGDVCWQLLLHRRLEFCFGHGISLCSLPTCLHCLQLSPNWTQRHPKQSSGNHSTTEKIGTTRLPRWQKKKEAVLMALWGPDTVPGVTLLCGHAVDCQPYLPGFTSIF